VYIVGWRGGEGPNPTPEQGRIHSILFPVIGSLGMGNWWVHVTLAWLQVSACCPFDLALSLHIHAPSTSIPHFAPSPLP